ncbi:hypothetical protein HDU98_006102, partial [Podochytrium sp. JEL0797]
HDLCEMSDPQQQHDLAILSLLSDRMLTLESRVIAQSQQILCLRGEIELLEKDEPLPLSPDTLPACEEDRVVYGGDEESTGARVVPALPRGSVESAAIEDRYPVSKPATESLPPTTTTTPLHPPEKSGPTATQEPSTIPTPTHPICESFNRRTPCPPTCSNRHVCLVCGGDHRMI